VAVACEELPPIFADHDRVEQVLLNLLSNAIRHNPAGTPVRLVARAAPANAVQIRVSDEGVGLPPELVAAPFEANRGHRSGSAGAGLGLSIARGIVEAHGGTIALEPSSPGTTFVIHLPIEPADVDHAPALVAASSASDER
jgi:signal transduction histidine kinase